MLKSPRALALSFFVVHLLAAAVAFAFQYELTPMSPYHSGRELRALKLGQQSGGSFAKERGIWVSAPIDEAQPEKGKIELFAYTYSAIDHSKPSMIYFAGGPGGWSHGFSELAEALPDWNVIFFDQRGTGFSRPEKQETLSDRAFMNSVVAAQDAERVRKALKLDKVSVYGKSYGTVPATIYASMYPETTTALVLEGIVDRGGLPLWSAPHRNRQIQEAFDGLPEKIKAKVREYAHHPRLQPTWFFDMARALMYNEKFEMALRMQLESIFAVPDPVQSLHAYGVRSFFYEDSLEFGGFAWAQIACAELGMTDPEPTWDYELKNDRFVPIPNPMTEHMCKPLGWTPENAKLYDAADYPVKVPVTYFQGLSDGATAPTSGLHHFHNVPQSRAQFMWVRDTGHSPLEGPLRLVSIKTPLFLKMQSFLRKGLKGESISQNEIKELNEGPGYGRWRLRNNPQKHRDL